MENILESTNSFNDEFNYKNILERRKLTLEELKAYYRDLRAYEYYFNDEVKGINIRKKINPLLVELVKIDRILNKRELDIIDDKRVLTDRPKIFALTHVGRYDIEVGIEVTKESSYLFMGDPNEVYRTLDIIPLTIKGHVFCDTDHREDCHIAELTGNKILKQNGNITIYPEGAWNITPNKIVQELFNGTVRMAKNNGAEIIPIAIENINGHYYANVGKNIYIPSTSTTSYRVLSNDLRDILATLKWSIIENQKMESRADLRMNDDDYVNSIMKDTENGYTVSEIERTRYHNPAYFEPEDVFSYEKKLIPNKNNAFLFKGLHDFK